MELYTFQQQLARMQKELDKTQEAAQEMAALRAEDERRLLVLRHQAQKEDNLAEEEKEKVQLPSQSSNARHRTAARDAPWGPLKLRRYETW